MPECPMDSHLATTFERKASKYTQPFEISYAFYCHSSFNNLAQILSRRLDYLTIIIGDHSVNNGLGLKLPDK